MTGCNPRLHTRSVRNGSLLWAKRIVVGAFVAGTLVSAHPAQGFPAMSPEIATDDPVYVPAANDQSLPKLAFDGTNYLAVWADNRRGTEWDVFGSRLSPSGAVLDPSGIPIAIGVNRLDSAVAFDGTNYVVVWSFVGPGTEGIAAVRVSPAGTVLDPTAMTITAAGASAPSIACGAPGCLLVWTGIGIYGARVTDSGLLDPVGFPISSGGSPSVCFDGANFLVAWQEQDPSSGWSDVLGARIAWSGAVLDSPPIAISVAPYDQRSPTIAYDGTNYLVAWEDRRTWTSSDIYAARLTTAAVLLDPAGIVVSNAASDQITPAVAFDGTNFTVTWQDRVRWGLYGARCTPAGTVLDPTGFEISGGSGLTPAVAFDGANYLVAWHDVVAWPPRADIYAARLSTAGAVLDPPGFVVSTSAVNEYAPAVGFDGLNYVVTWSDQRAGTWSTHAVRVAAAGGVLDPSGIAVGAGLGNGGPLSFDGTNYLVPMASASASASASAVRLNPSGRVLDPIPISIWPGALPPASAFDGTNHLILWIPDTSFHSVLAARVGTDGVVLDATPISIAVTGLSDWLYSPAVAFGGTYYLAVWEMSGHIIGARVTPAGVVIDPSGFLISDATFGQGGPAVGFDGTNFLVVYGDSRGPIYGTRVTDSGSVLEIGGFPISSGPGNRPAVAFNGSDYLVAWLDVAFGSSSDSARQILATRVSPAGTIQDTPIAVVSSPWSVDAPAVIAGAGERFLVAYQRFDPNPPYGSFRVRSRILACSSDVDCATGHCVDGVCCDLACGDGTADCMACSVAAGAARDGVCGPIICPGAGPCMEGVCDPGAGACGSRPAADGTSCDDNNGCTSLDTCVGGSCRGGLLIACDDGNPCTVDACDPSLGCTAALVAGPCDDGDPCTVADACNAMGTCAGTPDPACPGDGGGEPDSSALDATDTAADAIPSADAMDGGLQTDATAAAPPARGSCACAITRASPARAPWVWASALLVLVGAWRRRPLRFRMSPGAI